MKVFKGDIEEAAKELKDSVPADSKNYQDFLHQGYMYGHLAERLRQKAVADGRDWRSAPEVIHMAQQAVNALLKASKLNPQADDVWIALVRIVVNLGQGEKVQPVIFEAEKSLKGEQAPITLAKCLELMNQRELAQAKYESAAKASPQNSHVLREVAIFYLRVGNFDRAEMLLRQIVKLQTAARLGDVCWARRSLAQILRGRGDFDHLCQGLALIEENLHSKFVSIEDKRAKVQFLIADPRKEKIGEAIRAMEELVKGPGATPDDYFSLAKLYLKKGDWPGYSHRMHSVLGAQKVVPPAQLAFHIATLLEKKELDEADSWLKNLEKTAPNLFDTVRLRAEYLFLRGDYKAAGERAMAFLDNALAEPKDRGQQLLSVAQLMEEFSDRLKAEGKQVVAGGFAENANMLFASLQNKKVSETGDMQFAAYLARQKRIRECLDVLERCWDKGSAENLYIPVDAVIHSRAANAAQYGQLEKIMVAAANKSGGPAALLLVLADLHARQGQYDKSIADYREILAKEPRHYKAMNNLALYLARSGQNLDEALELIDRALAISGPMAVVLDSRAVVHIARQEPEKALEDLAAAIADDGSAEEYFHQAWAYSLAGKKAEATAAFAHAVQKGLDPKDLDPRETSVYDHLKDNL